MIYGLCILLFLIGLYAVLTKRNLIKIVIGFIIMENAVNLFLIMLGYRMGGKPRQEAKQQKMELRKFSSF